MITLITDPEIKGSNAIYECNPNEEQFTEVSDVSMDMSNERDNRYLVPEKDMAILLKKKPNYKSLCYVKGEPFIRYVTVQDEKDYEQNDTNEQNDANKQNETDEQNEVNDVNKVNEIENNSSNKIDTINTLVEQLIRHIESIILIIKRFHEIMKKEIQYRLKMLKFKRDKPHLIKQYSSLVELVTQTYKVRYHLKMIYSIKKIKEFLNENEGKIIKGVNTLNQKDISRIYFLLLKSVNALVYNYNSEKYSITVLYTDIGISNENENKRSIIEQIYDIINGLKIDLPKREAKELSFRLKTKKHIYNIQNRLYKISTIGIKHSKIKRKIISQLRKRIDETLVDL
jgi:hypothetical protein